ncbi:asparagine synthase-related protein [Nonomuraea sp. NPDC002799]
MAGHPAHYFVVLPDHPEAAVVAGRFSAGATHTLCHSSGRPLLLGVLPDDQVTIGEAGENRLVVIGRCPVTPARLRDEAARLRHPGGLDELAGLLPGSYHLLASIGGVTRVQGSACGLRRVLYASAGGVDVAADRSDVLAALLGARLDPGVLALRLLDVLPHPLADTSVWRGVKAVAPGDCLLFDTASPTSRTRRWWRPPPAELALDAGAHGVREALATAVEARTGAGGTITADLSGGLDSTSLCYLAADGAARVTAYTMASDDDADEDLRYARVAAGGLPAVEHVVYPARALPDFYGEPSRLAPRTDEPSLATLNQARVRWRLGLARERGARLHLDGLGGDQVLTGTPAFYHDLLRRRPLTTLSRLRRHRHLDGFDPRQAVRTLTDRSSYRAWYAATRARLLGGPGAPRCQAFDWEPAPALPAWITPEARRLIAERLDEAAEHAEPLAARRGAHADLAAIRGAGREVRLLGQLAPAGGPVAESPFLDDHVVHACLRVRPEERLTPGELKPLIKAAMAGLMPAELLRRRSKADGTTLAAEGFRRHRRDLAGTWSGSRLAELGLIDPKPLRRLTTLTYATGSHGWDMDTALAMEWWLRSAPG